MTKNMWAAIGVLFLSFSLSAQCDECNEPSPVTVGCTNSTFGLPCNVYDVITNSSETGCTPVTNFCKDCNYFCDSATGGPGVTVFRYRAIRLGAKCVRIGEWPLWMFRQSQTSGWAAGDDLPFQSVAWIAFDAAPLATPVEITDWPGLYPGAPMTCRLMVPFASFEAQVLTTITHSTPTVYRNWSFALPNNPALVGVTLYSQAIILTPPPRLDLLMTNAIQMVIGS